MRHDRVSKYFGCHWLFTSMHLHQCISYRYDDGSTDQLKDDWESTYGILSRRLCNGLSIQLMVDDLKMQILTFNIYLTQASPSAKPLFFYSLNYNCALSLKELNETHLHIYIHIYIYIYIFIL